MEYKKYAAFFMAGTVAGVILIKSQPAPQTETRTEYKDREVIVTRTVKSPDGTVVVDERKDVRREQLAVITAPAKKDWIVGASYGIAAEPYYGASVARRIIGDVYLNVGANTRQEVTAGLLITF